MSARRREVLIQGKPNLEPQTENMNLISRIAGNKWATGTVIAALAVETMVGSSVISHEAVPQVEASNEAQTLIGQTTANPNVTPTQLIGNTALAYSAPIKVPKKHLTKNQLAVIEVTPTQFKRWLKVGLCEEPKFITKNIKTYTDPKHYSLKKETIKVVNWGNNGSTYGGGLGISRKNWRIFKGQYYYGNESKATPYEQVAVGIRIELGTTNYKLLPKHLPVPRFIPDQGVGCHGW